MLFHLDISEAFIALPEERHGDLEHIPERRWPSAWCRVKLFCDGARKKATRKKAPGKGLGVKDVTGPTYLFLSFFWGWKWIKHRIFDCARPVNIMFEGQHIMRKSANREEIKEISVYHHSRYIVCVCTCGICNCDFLHHSFTGKRNSKTTGLCCLAVSAFWYTCGAEKSSANIWEIIQNLPPGPQFWTQFLALRNQQKWRQETQKPGWLPYNWLHLPATGRGNLLL